MLNLLRLPVEASTHAADIDNMIVLVHWLMLVLFVGWGTFFVFVLFRFRKSANPKADYVGGLWEVRGRAWRSRSSSSKPSSCSGYAIPACSDAREGVPHGVVDAVVVRVVAEQFAWNIQYPGPDGKFGRADIKLVAADNPLGLDRTDPNGKDDITEINQLTLPVNRPVLIHLSSKDVIHSFGLNEMRVKQDAIPGLDIPVWFIPNRVGEYEIACSQLCGLGHYRMRGFLNIKSDADYRAFLADEEKALTH